MESLINYASSHFVELHALIAIFKRPFVIKCVDKDCAIGTLDMVA